MEGLPLCLPPSSSTSSRTWWQGIWNNWPFPTIQAEKAWIYFPRQGRETSPRCGDHPNQVVFVHHIFWEGLLSSNIQCQELQHCKDCQQVSYMRMGENIHWKYLLFPLDSPGFIQSDLCPGQVLCPLCPGEAESDHAGHTIRSLAIARFVSENFHHIQWQMMMIMVAFKDIKDVTGVERLWLLE